MYSLQARQGLTRQGLSGLAGIRGQSQTPALLSCPWIWHSKPMWGNGAVPSLGMGFGYPSEHSQLVTV